MTEEEKKALEYFKALKKLTFEPYLSILLNLVNKQQKENKELKQITLLYNSYEVPSEERKIVIADSEYFINGFFKEHFISKDKIRAKIKEYDKWIEKGEYTESLEAQRYALKELLEE